MNKIRIRQDGKMFRIDEQITPGGLYFTWPETFATREGAEGHLAFIVSAKLGILNRGIYETD